MGQLASRATHPTRSDNASASATLGIWLRVMAPVAGSNWGGHLTPRPGQEVVVAFQNGNIDRPVIVGSVYNGQGSADAQGDPAADQLPAVDALKHAGEVMRATSTEGAQAASGSNIKTTQGGTGSVPAWSKPRIQYAAPGGIAQLTPKTTCWSPARVSALPATRTPT
ncbi:phage baseplate assembly protein V [Azonexus sp. IMCC34842]|uniref:phage baseplate assembly protein V n=1 Tax=Azonexus sp. IMCC34842 TaxID=3420950 RepID=UPI003D0FABBE